MKINDIEITDKFFAYDGCHKIYIIENDHEMKEAQKIGYSIFPIENIKECYFASCPLRFIENWSLTKTYASQWDEDDAEFED